MSDSISLGRGMLTAGEHVALDVTAELANLCRGLIGDGPTAEHDWNELAHRIHAVQHTILAQAAARAYPNRYRLLGGQPITPTTPADGCAASTAPVTWRAAFAKRVAPGDRVRRLNEEWVCLDVDKAPTAGSLTGQLSVHLLIQFDDGTTGHRTLVEHGEVFIAEPT